MTRRLLDVVEGPAARLVHRPASVVECQGYVYLPFGPSTSVVQDVRLGAGDLDRALAEVRGRAREQETRHVQWWVGSLSTPGDLAERLEQHGLVPDDDEPLLAALALDREPSGDGRAEARRVEVERVETFDDFMTAQRIDLVCMGFEGERLAEAAEGNRAAWPRFQQSGFLLYLARLEGEPVGMARAAPAEGAFVLLGGGTLPAARGRGVYTATVRARWDDAVAAGTPALVTQAGKMSRPILERLGFSKLSEIRILVDHL